MRLILTASLALLTLAAPAQNPAVSPETHAAVRNLLGEVLLNGQAYEYDRQLADFTQGVATTAVTAYAIADAARPFAPHYTPAQVEEMLTKAKELDSYKSLKALDWVP
jgi:hypothetical protein